MTLNPLKPIKRYLANRRRIKNEMILMVQSGAVRHSYVEIRYGKTRAGRSVRSSGRGSM